MSKRLIAWYWGFRDGWAQPYDLVWSRNVEHLSDDRHDYLTVQNWLDQGINLGQSLRGGRRSQADREGFVPFGLRSRLLSLTVCGWNLAVAGVVMGRDGLNGMVLVLLGVAVFFALQATLYAPRSGRRV